MAIFSAMSRFVYKLAVRPLLFSLDPETAHNLMTRIGSLLGDSHFGRTIVRMFVHFGHPILQQKLWNIHFSNPVGLAAGFDKDAYLYSIMGSVGFGFSEIGTVTYGAYGGNPKPRLYRLPKSKALVVNYGLKNIGAPAVTKSLKSKMKTIPQVISIGRTNSAAAAGQQEGVMDYLQCLERFIREDIGDIYEINISCPNTFGGEPFTRPDNLEYLLRQLYSLRIEKPIFLKMPVNLSWDEFQKLLNVAVALGVRAVVIGNLITDRSNVSLKDTVPENIKGAVSGRPTQELSNNLISKTYRHCGDRLKIVGVGGIFSADDAYEKIKLGASLVELITGMIYEGPQLIGEINRGLAELARKDGYKNISEAVGAYHRKAT